MIPVLKDYPEIRIWHAGCATGEEVFSMAILLEEEGLMDKTVIYATDMNEDVLEKAKQGAFSLRKMKSYTKIIFKPGKECLLGILSNGSSLCIFSSVAVKNIIFAQHNLVTDQSFNEFHVIICRNVLIYFTAQLQNQVYNLFSESLCAKGFLGLGDKETLRFAEGAASYIEFAGNERIYQKQ